MATETTSIWKRYKTVIRVGLIVICLWIIWEVVSRVRDIVEIGTAADP